jgi:hypothetical protein
MPLSQRFNSYHRHKRYSRVTARHSRVGVSGTQLDLGLQQPETPGQHGFPLRACGNDEGGSEVWAGFEWCAIKRVSSLAARRKALPSDHLR